MALYVTNLFANSPLLTYSPPVGLDPSRGWMNKPFSGAEDQYITSAPKASVSFHFYGDQFQLSGNLAASSDYVVPPCDFNITINGQLQYVESYYDPFNDLFLGHYHVEVTFFCPRPGQQASFAGPGFVETQTTNLGYQTNTFLDSSQIQADGGWQEQEVYQVYFAKYFPQYTTTTVGSTLSYQFKGVRTIIYGAVGPVGGEFIVSLNDVVQPVRSTYNPVAGDVTVLFFAQELANDKEHIVALACIGGNLTIQAIQYTVLY